MDQMENMYEFLDLTNVAESVRTSIVSSLHRPNPKVSGPWKEPLQRHHNVQSPQKPKQQCAPLEATVTAATSITKTPLPSSYIVTPDPTTMSVTVVNGCVTAPMSVPAGQHDTTTIITAPVVVETVMPAPDPPVYKSWARHLFTPVAPVNEAHLVNGINANVTSVANVSAQMLLTNGHSGTISQSPSATTNGNSGASQQQYVHKSDPEFDDPNYHRLAEFLTSYTVSHKQTNLQPRGLVNRSNYCYINSILQALIAHPALYNLLMGISDAATVNEKRKHTVCMDNMAKFAKEFNRLPPGSRLDRTHRAKLSLSPQPAPLLNSDPAFEPSWMYKLQVSTSFQTEGTQEDAEEFLGCLLNGLNDEMLALMKLVQPPAQNLVAMQNSDAENDWQVIGAKNRGFVTRRAEMSQTPISKIFGGQLRSRIIRNGDQSTDSIQPFFTLQLHIEKVSSVTEALEALGIKNKLEGVSSTKTNQLVEAWQQTSIEELPMVLILHLKYFDFSVGGCTKIIKNIIFPIELKIDNKLVSSKVGSSANERQYRLFAVVCHDGRELTKGHYVTDCYHTGYETWLRYDDASVRVIAEHAVLRPHGNRVPYLLFYRRMDTIPARLLAAATNATATTTSASAAHNQSRK